MSLSRSLAHPPATKHGYHAKNIGFSMPFA